MTVFENGVLRRIFGPERDEVTREWRKLHSEELCVLYFSSNEDRGRTVVKVLCYKTEGRWFDPSWYHWNFSLI